MKPYYIFLIVFLGLLAVPVAQANPVIENIWDVLGNIIFLIIPVDYTGTGAQALDAVLLLWLLASVLLKAGEKRLSVSTIWAVTVIAWLGIIIPKAATNTLLFENPNITILGLVIITLVFGILLKDAVLERIFEKNHNTFQWIVALAISLLAVSSIFFRIVTTPRFGETPLATAYITAAGLSTTVLVLCLIYLAYIISKSGSSLGLGGGGSLNFGNGSGFKKMGDFIKKGYDKTEDDLANRKEKKEKKLKETLDTAFDNLSNITTQHQQTNLSSIANWEELSNYIKKVANSISAYIPAIEQYEQWLRNSKQTELPQEQKDALSDRSRELDTALEAVEQRLSQEQQNLPKKDDLKQVFETFSELEREYFNEILETEEQARVLNDSKEAYLSATENLFGDDRKQQYETYFQNTDHYLNLSDSLFGKRSLLANEINELVQQADDFVPVVEELRDGIDDYRQDVELFTDQEKKFLEALKNAIDSIEQGKLQTKAGFEEVNSQSLSKGFNNVTNAAEELEKDTLMSVADYTALSKRLTQVLSEIQLKQTAMEPARSELSSKVISLSERFLADSELGGAYEQYNQVLDNMFSAIPDPQEQKIEKKKKKQLITEIDALTANITEIAQRHALSDVQKTKNLFVTVLGILRDHIDGVAIQTKIESAKNLGTSTIKKTASWFKKTTSGFKKTPKPVQPPEDVSKQINAVIAQTKNILHEYEQKDVGMITTWEELTAYIEKIIQTITAYIPHAQEYENIIAKNPQELTAEQKAELDEQKEKIMKAMRVIEQQLQKDIRTIPDQETIQNTVELFKKLEKKYSAHQYFMNDTYKSFTEQFDAFNALYNSIANPSLVQSYRTINQETSSFTQLQTKLLNIYKSCASQKQAIEQSLTTTNQAYANIKTLIDPFTNDWSLFSKQEAALKNSSTTAFTHIEQAKKKLFGLSVLSSSHLEESIRRLSLIATQLTSPNIPRKQDYIALAQKINGRLDEMEQLYVRMNPVTQKTEADIVRFAQEVSAAKRLGTLFAQFIAQVNAAILLVRQPPATKSAISTKKDEINKNITALLREIDTLFRTYTPAQEATSIDATFKNALTTFINHVTYLDTMQNNAPSSEGTT